MIGNIIRGNLTHQPLSTLLSMLLLMLGTAIISLLFILEKGFSKKMDQDLRNIDIVVGAKGSPLQLVLSAVYHMDAPTGNIPLSEVRKLQQQRMIAQTTPLAYGDTYKGYRILGTDSTYLEKYDATFADGSIFKNDFEAVIGSTVAQLHRLQIGDQLVSTHGSDENAHEHEASPYTVKGILDPSGTVLDYLVMTNIHTVWAVHHPSEVSETDQEYEMTNDSLQSQDEITALLIQLKSPMGLMTLPRIINESSQLQAAVPVLEINRLFGLLGIGTSTIQAIAGAIILISAFSIFIALYSRMQERKHEMAIMRMMGCSRGRLSFMVMAEAWIIAILGYILGWLLSRLGVFLLLNNVSDTQTWPISYTLSGTDLLLLAAVWMIGTISALIPAIQAFRMNISQTLAHD